MTQHKIVEVRRKPLKTQRRRVFQSFRFPNGWARVASPFMVRFANSSIWRRVYVNQYDSNRGYRRGTYYVQSGRGWFTFNYNDIAPFIEVCDGGMQIEKDVADRTDAGAE